MPTDVQITVGAGEEVTIRVKRRRITIDVERTSEPGQPIEEAGTKKGAVSEKSGGGSLGGGGSDGGRFRGRTDEEARADILAALERSPRGMGRDALREVARVRTSRVRRIQADLIAEGLAQHRGRRLRAARFEGARGEFLEKTPEDDHATDVYFAQAAEGGPVKIGASAHPKKRLAELQRNSPTLLRILATVSGGGYAKETALHAQFADERLHGEWFQPSARLLEWIATNATPQKGEGASAEAGSARG